ncbi:MAG: S41 family peptidase [Bacteroidales bacterium]|nr:S41 family peptidase [Bacteroidales bacterium]
MKYIRLSLLTLLTFFLITATPVFGQSQNNFEISKNLDIFTTLLKELDRNYADQIKPGELTETAIKAMLESLDPFTVYIPESNAEDYKLMTTGQYGGIGALIHKQGDYVVITEPYEGFPAQKSGLKAGDKILEINGKSMKDRRSDEVSEILKGQPGVELTLLIERAGQKPMQVKVVREEIKIPNIPYYGMLYNNIGYIKLSNFTQQAGNEVKKAFLDLKGKDELNGIILDLRGNGGGLLNEAVNVANIFMDQNQLIVSTKGKIASRNQDHSTRFTPVDTKIPLAVLVDRNSASASEIVAGAVQDLDRGVVIGQRTFGKGLVQNVIPLSYNSQVKITVAKYYIPSGRCIQSIDYFHKDDNGNYDKIPDSLISEFKTKNGRAVYDGGGIQPDISMKPMRVSKITQTLIMKYLLFDFANDFALRYDNISSPEKFQVTDEIFQELVEFLKDKDYDYQTGSEEALEKLKANAIKENYFESISEEYEALKTKILHDKQEDLLTYRDEVKLILKDEIVARYYYQKGRIITSLKDDPEIAKAMELLERNDSYLAILDGKFKPEKALDED